MGRLPGGACPGTASPAGAAGPLPAASAPVGRGRHRDFGSKLCSKMRPEVTALVVALRWRRRQSLAEARKAIVRVMLRQAFGGWARRSVHGRQILSARAVRPASNLCSSRDLRPHGLAAHGCKQAPSRSTPMPRCSQHTVLKTFVNHTLHTLSLFICSSGACTSGEYPQGCCLWFCSSKQWGVAGCLDGGGQDCGSWL